MMFWCITKAAHDFRAESSCSLCCLLSDNNVPVICSRDRHFKYEIHRFVYKVHHF